MPELPEVETITRALQQCLKNCEFRKIESFIPKLREPLTLQDCPTLLDVPITAVRRRARYIIIELANRRTIIIHLGMSGNLRTTPANTPRWKHEHVIFYLSNGETLRFNCPRRFGFIIHTEVAIPGGEPAILATLGPEPLSRKFTAEYLKKALKNRTLAIKSAIMDNRMVVGVGNIYANEALFLSRIHPLAKSGRISLPRLKLLVKHIKTVLRKAIKAGGTTIVDFRGFDGSEGKFYRQLHIYGKNGNLCQNCEIRKISRITVGGRGTFFCSQCQKK